ncbi:hypothetical protein RYX36_012515 [Vicia faba]
MIIATMVKSVPLNYGDALTKSILFFEGQRSGYLPASQRMTWRKNSALNDGSDIHMRMDGGYYDAGDNVKFHFPMAFTTTMLAWSVIEFGDLMGPDLQHAFEAIRWGTDYFLKATNDPNVVIAQIGDPNSDHSCWERPEDMDTSRKTYVVTTSKPGSEVSAEIASALAASSIALSKNDGRYSRNLLLRAKQVFDFANNHRGSYNDSIGDGVCPFYCDINGYMDELVWGAAWLYKASNDITYWNFVKSNIQSLGPLTEFGWDAKHAGINVLISEVSALLIISGLLFKLGPSNLQHVTSYSFLLIVYARYMQVNHKTVNCGNVVAKPADLVNLAKTQVDYVLGNNPLGMSYMVGYGQKFPQKIHHRASTMPSIDVYPKHIKCRDGDKYFESQSPNINLLTGAIVGGPAEDDSYQDSRFNVTQSEPTTYINAPFVGVLAYFKQRNP